MAFLKHKTAWFTCHQELVVTDLCRHEAWLHGGRAATAENSVTGGVHVQKQVFGVRRSEKKTLNRDVAASVAAMRKREKEEERQRMMDLTYAER